MSIRRSVGMLLATAMFLVATVTSSSAPDPAPYPVVPSKKGLQVQMVDDAVALGVRHAALNVNFANFLRTEKSATTLPMEVDGHTFHIDQRGLAGTDQQVRALTKSGAILTLILLYYESGDAELNKLMLHPRYAKDAPNKLTAFSTALPRSAAAFKACVAALAARYSGDPSHGRVWNYVVGNEVNSHWHWHNMGPTPMRDFARDYERAVRLTHEVVRRYSEHARVFLSLEHHWNIRYAGGTEEQTFAGRPFLDYFAELARANGDFDWHLAFHPYPENLFEPRTWNDKSATAGDDSARITFKNIDVLTRYFARPEMLYKGNRRRIILSEQGFHSPDSPEGEVAQAAAYAYAYKKVEKLDGIDAFILHRHVDHGQEGGLNLGLWSRKPDSIATPERRKKIYNVFKAADTPEWEQEFRFALPVIGVSAWNEALAID